MVAREGSWCSKRNWAHSNRRPGDFHEGVERAPGMKTAGTRDGGGTRQRSQKFVSARGSQLGFDTRTRFGHIHIVHGRTHSFCLRAGCSLEGLVLVACHLAGKALERYSISRSGIQSSDWRNRPRQE